ncbi:hypothetical protein BUALT_Bualt11G0098500 [Buddleja alternifolia]|uniref:Iron-sulfur cluster biosynthesis family protein n=1 Tax=Buddleja alternifolia TaxID=168488 RepID=A0AAV6WSZ4_9LAMI|nr:hypothetical protein BUALT_Bualt11G0098500 [Buddleja alternifolia]
MASIYACFFTVTAKSNSRSLKIQLLKPQRLRCFTPLFNPRIAKLRCGKTSISLIRASGSVDVASTSAIRPGGSVESDKLPSDVRKRTMDAVDSCGRRVTIGDVASKAGLKLNEAQKALQALAVDTNGFLEVIFIFAFCIYCFFFFCYCCCCKVSDEGDVLYVFPKGYRSKLAAKSFRMKVEPLLEKGKMAAEYLVRVSFGTALIASIFLVYTTIIAILLGSGEEDGCLSSTDLFWYWDPYYYSRRQVREGDGGMNFIDSAFSFVFGDGDPNQGIEEERWKLGEIGGQEIGLRQLHCEVVSGVSAIGQYIASNGGVVTAEELAPYLDLESTENTDDDSYILPVLLSFDGQPEVDEEGNILYRFPSLQCTATPRRSGQKEYVGRRWANWVGALEKLFKEKKWQFSKTSASERAMAFGLGALNLFGVIILSTMLRNMKISPSGFISFVSGIFHLLQIYAASFFAIPLIRWFFIQNKNAQIVKRNQAREQRARALESPDLSLRRKLLSARDMAQKTFIGQDRIVYSTERDLYEQDIEAREWDQRFKEIEKSK